MGFVHPFPAEIVKAFASKVKKLIVIEELRPYIEENLQRLNLEVFGKSQLGLEEIGEFTPDNVRQALANLGLTSKAEKPEPIDLPPRPPALCPGCPHRAFYYALNMTNQHVECDSEKCVGCDICEYACSFEKEKVFNPLKSRIRSVRVEQILNTAVTCKACIDAPCIHACPEDAITQSKKTGAIVIDESKCKGCDWCIEACKYGAITLHPTSHKAIICDTCGGNPKCIPACPESALTLTGRSNDKIVTGDIGCYTLGVLPPVSAVQTCLCMGAGISQAAGMIHAGVKDKVFAVIGDSTFFHAGMPGLLNIVYNKANVCVVIMDNSVVAMTGHQPTPGSGKTAMGTDAKVVRIEDIAKGVGIEKVVAIDPYDIKAATAAVRETLEYQGPSVIISQRPCPLLIERGKPREVKEECNACGVCVKAFGCPAISLKSEHAEIDDNTLLWVRGMRSCMPLRRHQEERIMNLDIVFSGVGGQGVVVLSDIYCEAAMLDGFDVAKAEIHGMAQRGGSIVAYTRIGGKVESPLIETGKADAIVGFEILETARALPMLKKNGTVIVNMKYIPPNCMVTGAKPKKIQELMTMLRTKALVHEVEGVGIAEKLGNMLVVNTILLGALSALPEIPVKVESFEHAIAGRLKEKYINLNLKAFQLGRESVLKS